MEQLVWHSLPQSSQSSVQDHRGLGPGSESSLSQAAPQLEASSENR
jgi:hypothetical protein